MRLRVLTYLTVVNTLASDCTTFKYTSSQ